MAKPEFLFIDELYIGSAPIALDLANNRIGPFNARRD
jgi:hypothetical protein